MQAEEIIKHSIKYIEQNLKESIELEVLANLAGYSIDHYQKLFSKITGISVAKFLNKRRLDAALVEIYKGRRTIDVAFDYGFESYAGFYKAFVRTYGGSPKKYLSKEESSMISEIELRKILENWDIPQDLPILTAPTVNPSSKVWIVGKDYVLKTEEKSRLLTNLKIVKALSALSVNVGAPISTKLGEDYLDGEHVFTLTRGIKGKSLSKDEHFGKNRKQFGVLYGESIAHLHQSLKSIEPELNINQVNLYKQLTEWAIPLVKKINLQWSMGIQDSFFENYMTTFEKLYPKLPEQLVHRDPNPGNIMFENGKVSGFIDFDISERNVRLWDPCYCATGILASWNDISEIQTLWPEILLGVLQGYNRINPLTNEEKMAVYSIICAIQMIFVAYCDDVPELQELAKTNREMLVYMIDNENVIKGIVE